MSHKPVVFSSLLLLNVPQFVQIYPLNVFLVWICGRWIVQDNHKLMLNGIYLQLSFSCDWTWLPSYLIWNYCIWRLWSGKWLLYWFIISIPSLLFLLWDPRKKMLRVFLLLQMFINCCCLRSRVLNCVVDLQAFDVDNSDIFCQNQPRVVSRILLAYQRQYIA